jgi:hypothetical protein
MAEQRRAGLIKLYVGGEVQDAKGNFTYNLGRSKRESIIGADGVHGYKEIPQVPFIEGAITDRGTLDLGALASGRDLTISLELGNGKLISLRDAWFAADGNASTEEAEITVRWEGASAEEVA